MIYYYACQFQTPNKNKETNVILQFIIIENCISIFDITTLVFNN